MTAFGIDDNDRDVMTGFIRDKLAEMEWVRVGHQGTVETWHREVPHYPDRFMDVEVLESPLMRSVVVFTLKWPLRHSDLSGELRITLDCMAGDYNQKQDGILRMLTRCLEIFDDVQRGIGVATPDAVTAPNGGLHD